jgi:hypothetical protein
MAWVNGFAFFGYLVETVTAFCKTDLGRTLRGNIVDSIHEISCLHPA